MDPKTRRAYSAISASMREFGYPDVTSEMVAEVHEAMREHRTLPHGIVGMFAKDHLQRYIDAGLLPAV
jgi:hypothetical protein